MNESIDVIILTDSRYEAPANPNAYVRQLLHEDGLLQAALERRGLRCRRLAWSSAFDWSRARAALFRSTWDYFDRFEEFSAWLDRAARAVRLFNPVELVRWNADKRYLLDLAERGLPLPPTRFLPAGDPRRLAEHLGEAGWPEAVLKPVISGAARHTHRVRRENADEVDSLLEGPRARESFFLQRFEERILTEGEISLVVVGGRFTHAVRKIAKPGDFRVQDDHGGTVEPYRASPEEAAFAERCAAACDPRPLYARVDVVRDAGGSPLLMELELIEPELFFRFHPPAAEALAEALARQLVRSPSGPRG